MASDRPTAPGTPQPAPEPGAEAEAGASGRPSALLPVLFGIVVIDLIGFGIVMPILPFWAEQYGANGLILGALLTCHAGMQFVMAPRWGRLSDRIGRRPVMLFTIFGTAGSLLLLGLAQSLAWLFVARLLSGTFAANISVATAYVADVTDEHERTNYMGKIGASFGIGFVLGPAIGGGLAFLGYGVPMLLAAGLAFANGILAVFALKEPARHASQSEAPMGRLQALRDPRVARLCSINLLFSLAVTQLESIFAFYMLHSFGYDALEVAGILVLMAVVMGGIQGGGMKKLAARFGEKALLGTGLVLMAIAFALVPAPAKIGGLLAVLVLAAIGRGLCQPPMMSLVSVAAPADSRGAVMGSFQSAASAARVIGPLIAGALYDRHPSWPFYLAAVLALFAVVGALGVRAESVPAREASPEPG